MFGGRAVLGWVFAEEFAHGDEVELIQVEHGEGEFEDQPGADALEKF